MRQGEFIGTMMWQERETEHRFVARAIRWLEERYQKAVRSGASAMG
jgi:hypothetical protein